MFLTRSWFQKRSRWNRLPTELDPLSVPGVLAPTEMESAFRRERARVDRNDQAFSIVVFRVDPKRRDDLRRVAEVLVDRIRAYDALGVVDTGRLAALLPETDGKGSWTFADNAMAQLSRMSLRVSCEVFSYPNITEAETDAAEAGSDRASSVGGYGRVLRPDRDTDGAEEHSPASDEVPTSALDSIPDHRPLSTGTDGQPVIQPALDPQPSVHALHRLAPIADSLPAPMAAVQIEAVQLEATPKVPTTARPVRDLTSMFVEPLPFYRRAVDVIVSGGAILALSPILLTTAALVKCTSPGSIIFWQWRVGRGGERFKFYKFRSMVQDAESRKNSLRLVNEKEGPIFKIKHDPRITRVGRVIRRLSIDELPQLFNVLKGDMTLVGPRPPVVDEVKAYEPWQRQRLDITGGLTCIWQVSGRSEVSFDDWMRMDIRYKQRRTLGLDLKLMWKTFGAVFSGRGAY